MALQPHPKRKGLFQDPDLREGPATFAVIIGVSAYRHLEGRRKKASPTYGLGQLAVSAVTAQRFFEWVASEYLFDEAPLSKCWILTAPTAAEKRAVPALAKYPVATMDNCADAIGEWKAAIEALPFNHASKSRAIFFFSGHGIERGKDRQILLPTDYLRPPAEAVNDAISTYNIFAGLRHLPLLADFIFVDACRALPTEMAGLEIDGRRILNEHSRISSNANRVSPIVYASAAGHDTWQPSKVKDGISFFGEALIAGLRREQARNAECGHPARHITLFNLASFVQKRVAKLLDGAVLAPVKLGGEIADVCVTDLVGRPKSATAEAEGSARTDVLGPEGFDERMKAADTLAWLDLETTRAEAGDAFVDDMAIDATLASLSMEAEDTIDASAIPPRARDRIDLSPPVRANAGSFGALHGPLKHEALTRMWTQSKSTALNVRAATGMKLDSVESFGRSGLRVGFRLANEKAAWVEFPCPEFGTSYYAALPAAANDENIRFDAEIVDDIGRPVSFELSLSLDNESWLGHAARMWDKHCMMQQKQALDELDASRFEQMLREKIRSPLSATVAGLFLLRAGQHDRLHDWLRNLCNRFPHLPDGAVLWAEQLRQTQTSDEEPVEIVRALLTLEDRGAPFLSGVLEYALQIVEELCVHHYADDRQLGLPQRTRAKGLRKLRAWLRHAATYARPGGLFQTYVAKPGKLTKSLVLAPKR